VHRLRLAESDAVHFGIQVPNRYHTYRYHTGNKTTVTVHVSYRYHTVTTHRYPTGIPQVTYRYPIGNISTGTLQYHTGATHTHTHTQVHHLQVHYRYQTCTFTSSWKQPAGSHHLHGRQTYCYFGRHAPCRRCRQQVLSKHQ
jgi:hypothetical protein